MKMHFPAEIISERFGQDAGRMRLGHHDMMLEALLADVVHEFLQVRDFCNRAISESVEFVVR